jgi:hypothetical protein
MTAGHGSGQVEPGKVRVRVYPVPVSAPSAMLPATKQGGPTFIDEIEAGSTDVSAGWQADEMMTVVLSRPESAPSSHSYIPRAWTSHASIMYSRRAVTCSPHFTVWILRSVLARLRVTCTAS